MPEFRTIAFDPLVLTSTSIAGFLTWVILNRLPVRGDHASIVYTVTFAALYLSTCFSRQTEEAPFIFCSIIASTYACSALLSTVVYRLCLFHPLAGFPGPILWRVSSLRLSYASFTGRRHLLLHDMHNRYGPFVRIGPNILSINTPSAQLIYGGGYSMEKSDAYATPGHLNAVAMFFKQKSQDIHSTRKRIWSNAFKLSSVASFFLPLERRTWQLVKCIETRMTDDGTVDISECISHWSYDFMGEMAFGGNNKLELMRDGDPEGLVDGLKRAAIAMDRHGWPDPASVKPPGSWISCGTSPVANPHKIRHRAAAMMRTRIQTDQDVDMRDLTSHLLAGDPQTGERLTQADLDLEATVAIQGGSDNTSTILTLVFYFLLSRPIYFQRLRAELDDAFPDPTGHINLNKLTGLKVLNAIINETLRLGSPFFLPRVVPPTGATISGKVIPPGTIIALAAYSQQISAENFSPEPLEFLPDRWYSDGPDPGSKADKSVLASFSYGPHACVARSFAYQELRFVVARLVLVLDMSLPKSFDITAFRDGILNMRTTVFERPLIIKATKRVGLEIKASL